jgi:aromatic ring-opening dioxygenase LigB subunit
MPLVFAGILPSSPLLLKEITTSSESLAVLDPGIQAFEEQLYLAKPEICILISESASTIPETCTVHAVPSFTGTLAHFGDFSKEVSWNGSPDVAAKLQHASYHSHVPMKLDSAHQLDNESTVALELIGSHLKHCKMLPMGSMIDAVDTNVALGRLLLEFAMTSNKRVACIALGNLAATHDASSPFGEVDGSASFDVRIRNIMVEGNCTALQHLTDYDPEAMQASLFTPLLILSGMCASMHATYQELGYTIDQGIGYTVGTLDVT